MVQPDGHTTGEHVMTFVVLFQFSVGRDVPSQIGKTDADKGVLSDTAELVEPSYLLMRYET